MQPLPHPSVSPLPSFASRPGFVPRPVGFAEALKAIVAFVTGKHRLLTLRERIAERKRIERLAEQMEDEAETGLQSLRDKSQRTKDEEAEAVAEARPRRKRKPS